MKKATALLSIVLSASFFSTAQAAVSTAEKSSISSEIAAKARAFVEIANGDPAPAYSPEQALRSFDEKENALEAIATEIWQLRAQMMDQKIAEAEAFQF